MLRAAYFVLILITGLSATAQKTSSSKFNVGIEQDVLPYATGGYFAGVWAGKDHVRGRVLVANVHKPDFIIKKGFSNNKVTAYALLGDYFLKKNWRGWWAGSGLVYWKSSIQSNKKIDVANYETWLLNGSVGYDIKLYKNFYLSPWAGMHLRICGATEVKVGDKTFTPPLLNPEASLKIGVYF